VTQESLEKERRKLQRAQKREDIPARTPVPSTNKQKSSDSPIREKKHPQPPDSKVQYVENLDEDE
jgi:vacuolar-type H+-ATPase subunit F/Vma7